jgi:FixJ family two-component response regulator
LKRIIIIDDNAAIRDVYEMLFMEAGYAVTCFASEQPVLNNEFTEPDIFLIDRQLHGASGIDLCSYIRSREQHSDTPVIIFSASPFTKISAEQAGATAFLEKPFSNQTLLDLVEKILQ